MSLVLRYGPLVAAFALGLAAVIESFVPGYSGILNNLLGVLGFLGVQPDQAIVGEVGNVVAGALALIGVGRKLYSLVSKYINEG